MSDLEDIEVWWKRLGCIRNPGTHTGEESARDAEIKELRQALAERVNHLELLKKYMRHVAEEEGIDFTRRLNSDDNETRFTDDEVEELERISQEYQLEAKYG